jgi:hypothetical protein
MTAAGIGRVGSVRMAQTAIFRFSIPGVSIPGVSIHWLRDQAARKRITWFFQRGATWRGLPLQYMINWKSERKVQMLRSVLIAALLCASEAAFSQELTAEQRSACKGDYQK